ncbi:MAG TPA: pyridoxamine 5'-phosphate oxidase family protein [Acidimicrobiales bacterium]|nr:pyridoxamine 5'-phosphate oxidase family protein [Acidimicrobiales bacterium]
MAEHSPTLSRTLSRTERSTLWRKRERGSYDRALAEAVLDEALVCHVGFELDGWPHVLPMAHARVGDDLYLHGARANRMLRRLAQGAHVCVTATLVDGIVLARAAAHHSLNYRCVVLYGSAVPVTDDDETDRASAALLEHMAPGRAGDARRPDARDRQRTAFVRLAIDEGSVKVRTGPPVDDGEDLALPVWAGVVPLSITAGAPYPDPVLDPAIPTPPYAAAYPTRGAARG